MKPDPLNRLTAGLCVYVKKEGKKLRKSLGKVRAAVCPVCGEVSLFVSEPEDARWNG